MLEDSSQSCSFSYFQISQQSFITDNLIRIFDEQQLLSDHTHTPFFNKNKLNKNTEAEIAQKNQNKLRTD